ncbi:hypothetical protein M0802_006877 [Mischocyttarus mexicanus]|nr:hypothetical protein M0802_006877 [Mischocyttarus mexicanus]
MILALIYRVYYPQRRYEEEAWICGKQGDSSNCNCNSNSSSSFWIVVLKREKGVLRGKEIPWKVKERQTERKNTVARRNALECKPDPCEIRGPPTVPPTVPPTPMADRTFRAILPIRANADKTFFPE